ncbi:MAG: DUF4876 domain-containing protein [Bacteroidales bacterium]|jgi:hypothetical protein|nr:DUF4876 domain-containing protein [Bacteroidales bacterium]
MKKIFLLSAVVCLFSSVTTSCIKMMQEANQAEKVHMITVSYKVNAVTGFVPYNGEAEPDPTFQTKGLEVNFINYQEGSSFKSIVGDNNIVSCSLTPGVYAVSVSGSVTSPKGTYRLNGSSLNVPFTKDITPQDVASNPEYTINIRPAKVGSVLFSEIYYCGVAPYYFRDQTYTIYNNGQDVFYLDGLCFAQLHPNIATTNLPSWPEEDGRENYVYGLVVWQFPGSGKQYPLKPGEAVVVAQEAINHTVNNPASFNNSMSEWECWSGNALRGNPDCPDMPYIFWWSPNKMQWLTSVFGAAFCIFRIDDAVVNKSYWELPGNWQVVVGPSSTRYAKIPADAVLDGVELLTSMSALNMKRIPGFVDAGGTSVETTYNGKSVSRKVIGERADGTPIYQDTNNSTNDFQVNDSPTIRRDGQKIPAWSRANAL